ncbi:MAG: cohesin domain-containing protein [Methanophagales archaeon]|nr:cohesin domain-containing protein [Methanophagales archaeon]
MKNRKKKKEEGVKLVMVGLVALSVLVVTATPAYAQQNITVSIGDISLLPQESATIPIDITKDTVQEVSGARINLTYDPNVVQVTAIGDSDFDNFFYNFDVGVVSITVKMIGFQGTTSLTTPIKFADVTFKAIGYHPGDYTDLNLEIVELNTATGSPIYPREVRNGSVSIVTPETITETEYWKLIPQPVNVSKIYYKFKVVDGEWAAKWTNEIMYAQKETKYSIAVYLDKVGYVTGVDFERWGFPTTEIPYDLAVRSLDKLDP